MAISAIEIEEMADYLAMDSLPDPVTIQRYTTATDGFGSSVNTWVTLLTTVCRLAPSTYLPSEREQAGRLLGMTRWIVTMPADTDVRETDRLIIETRTYEVVSVFHRATMEVSRRCLCETRL